MAIEDMLGKKSKKTTLGKLQHLCGLLNFLGKAIVPGRAFTRRLYSFGSHLTKKRHHLKVKTEMREDLEMWQTFLQHQECFSRRFVDLEDKHTAVEIDWYTDAAKTLGLGGYNKQSWFIGQWNEEFIKGKNPSINYLELFAVCVAVLNWIHEYENQHIVLFCDNMSVVHMINNQSSKCKNCMFLIRIVVLKSLLHNTKISAKHVKGELNIYADFLSRLKYREFRRTARAEGKKFNKSATQLPSLIWPPKDIWID